MSNSPGGIRGQAVGKLVSRASGHFASGLGKGTWGPRKAPPGLELTREVSHSRRLPRPRPPSTMWK